MNKPPADRSGLVLELSQTHMDMAEAILARPFGFEERHLAAYAKRQGMTLNQANALIEILQAAGCVRINQIAMANGPPKLSARVCEDHPAMDSLVPND
jgi:hypothetical protein